MALLLILLAADIQGSGGEPPRFRDAVPGRNLSFPRDHGKHPEFQTEWWYFTGNLKSKDRTWGFQLTFFRRSLVKEKSSRKSAWATRDLYPAHFAITDITNRTFHHAELMSREGPGLARSDPDRLSVRIRDWSAEQNGETIHVKARHNGYALNLRLTPVKPVVLHGDRGYSRKGDADGQASYYYSFTRLHTVGTLTYKGTPYQVTGLSWMDHEFGSSILLPDQAGWDWFSLQLDDGSELMIFHLRKRDGSFERPFGTVVPGSGAPIDLAGQRIFIAKTGTWSSPHTKAVYPSGWKMDIPSQRISLRIDPVFKDQELSTAKSTAVVYWEGAVNVRGSRDGRPVQGRGYVELTGYAHSMGGRL
jgi:predicted secreted hydrolase